MSVSLSFCMARQVVRQEACDMRRDPPGLPNDRKSERLKTFEPIILSDTSGEARAHLLNISRTGGLIHAETTLQVGKIVQINLLGEWHVGSVVWSAPPRFGVSFTIRLSDEKLARLTRQRR
jgi:hypothetical protein